MSFFNNIKSKYNTSKFYAYANTKRQSEIIDQVNDNPCEDKYGQSDEDDYGERDFEECIEEFGDTGYLFEEPTSLPKGTWLIHFTKSDPRKIIKEGFEGAALEHLGLTKGGGRRLKGDFALAYLLKDRQALSSDYGSNAIVFQSDDAVLAWHKSDNEHQVIFFVPTMRSILCISSQMGGAEVFDKKGKSLGKIKSLTDFKNNIEKYVHA